MKLDPRIVEKPVRKSVALLEQEVRDLKKLLELRPRSSGSRCSLENRIRDLEQEIQEQTRKGSCAAGEE